MFKGFSIREYFRKLFRDERRRKAFFVGLVVFFVVFAGLTIYGKAVNDRKGDVILTDGGTAEAQGASGEGGLGDSGGNGNDGFSGGNGSSGDGNNGGSGDGSNGNNGGGGTGQSMAGGGGGNGSSGSGGSDGGGATGAGAGTGGGNSGQAGGASAEQIAIFVDVGGAVNINGLFALPAGSRVADAIEAAGGLKEDANVKYINRATVLYDGDRLYIPTDNEVRNGTAPPTAGQVTASGGYGGSGGNGSTGSPPYNGPDETSDSNSTSNGLININTADSAELQKLNGVGPVTAQKIIDYRTKSGGFRRIEDITNVSGIGAKTFERLKSRITV